MTTRAEAERDLKQAFTIERYADVLASLTYYRGHPIPDVLRTVDVTNDLWEQAEPLWVRQLAIAERRGQLALLVRFASRFASSLGNLRAKGLTLDQFAAELQGRSNQPKEPREPQVAPANAPPLPTYLVPHRQEPSKPFVGRAANDPAVATEELPRFVAPAPEPPPRRRLAPRPRS